MIEKFMIFSLALYHPSPVSILDMIFSRGMVTLSNGESQLALINQGAELAYTANRALDVRVHINKDTIEVIRIENELQNSSKGGGNLALLEGESVRSFRQSIHQKYDLSVPFNGDHIGDESGVLLESSTGMNLENVMVRSPLVALFAKKYTFNHCVCDAKTLVIASQDSNSWYDSIQFVFDEQSKKSHKISGTIDFETDNGDFTVLGVKTIKVQLSERAFTSQGKPILVIEPGGDLFKI